MNQFIRRHYHYVIAAGAFVTVAVIIGLCNNLYTLFTIPVTTALGISRGAFSVSQSLRYAGNFLSSLLMGGLYRKYGYRRPTTIAILLASLIYLGYSLAQDILPFLIGSLLFGLMEYFLTTAAVTRLLGNWFYSHQGLAIGAAMAGSGVGGSILSLVLSSIMERSDFRAALRFAALLLLLTAGLVFFIMKDRPEEMGLSAYHDPDRPQRTRKKKRLPTAWEGVPAKELFRKPFFYLTMLGMVLAPLVSNGIYIALVPHLQDQGFSPSFAASMLSLVLILMAVNKILLGMLSDRIGAHHVVMLCLISSLLAVVLLADVKSSAQAVTAAILMAISTCLQGFVQPLLAAELVGRQAYGVTLGLILAMLSLGALAASPLMNFFYDLNGSYTQILLILAAVCAADALLLVPAFHMEQKFRRRVEQKGDSQKNV